MSNNFMLWSLLLWLSLIKIIKSDTFLETRSRLSIRLDTNTASNIFMRASSGRNFIRLLNDEQVIVTCSKSHFSNGTIAAYVNSMPAQTIQCTRYYKRYAMSDENSCQTKQFLAKFVADRSSFIEVSCRIAESIYYYDSINLVFTRLYDDAMPRIRNGLVLSAPNSIVAYYVNMETVSCEAIRSNKAEMTTFDSIQWFTVDFRYKLDTFFVVNRIDDNVLNYTITFPVQSPLVKNNSIYNCCTFKNGVMVNCQAFLAFIVDQSSYGMPQVNYNYNKIQNKAAPAFSSSSTTKTSKLPSSSTWYERLTTMPTTKKAIKSTSSFKSISIKGWFNLNAPLVTRPPVRTSSPTKSISIKPPGPFTLSKDLYDIFNLLPKNNSTKTPATLEELFVEEESDDLTKWWLASKPKSALQPLTMVSSKLPPVHYEKNKQLQKLMTQEKSNNVNSSQVIEFFNETKIKSEDSKDYVEEDVVDDEPSDFSFGDITDKLSAETIANTQLSLLIGILGCSVILILALVLLILCYKRYRFKAANMSKSANLEGSHSFGEPIISFDDSTDSNSDMSKKSIDAADPPGKKSFLNHKVKYLPENQSQNSKSRLMESRSSSGVGDNFSVTNEVILRVHPSNENNFTEAREEIKNKSLAAQLDALDELYELPKSFKKEINKLLEDTKKIEPSSPSQSQPAAPYIYHQSYRAQEANLQSSCIDRSVSRRDSHNRIVDIKSSVSSKKSHQSSPFKVPSNLIKQHHQFDSIPQPKGIERTGRPHDPYFLNSSESDINYRQQTVLY